MSDENIFEESTGHVRLHAADASFVARRLIRSACDTWPVDQVDAARLLVTELVANALEHGGGDVGLRIYRTADLLRVEVSDGNPNHPHIVDPPPSIEVERGRGLHIVASLASSWGSRSDGDSGGKTVWFELRRVGRG